LAPRGNYNVDQIVGIGEMAVSNKPEGYLKTYSLGSCVAVALYDPTVCVGGLIHCMLPLSTLDAAKAAAKPAMFTDTGVVALLSAVFALGAERKRLIVKVAGGASQLGTNAVCRIGERNYAVLRKVLWKNNILITAEDVGGSRPRTVFLNMATGITTIRSDGQEVEL
jgi:chemotaxis protein CheD